MAFGWRVVAAGVMAVAAALATSFAPARAEAGPAAAPPSAAAPAVAVRAPATDAAIRPGVLTETAGGGLCTANFVFTSGERTFLGQAAHCGATGPATETDGCTSAVGPLGVPVTIRATDGTRRVATLVYSSWVAMQAGGETDPEICASNDFALVELAAADVPDVDPSVPFFGGPTGLDTDGLPVGEEVFGYGSPQPRTGPAGVAAPVRPKVGLALGDGDGGRTHQVSTTRPGVIGDSGAGFLDSDGSAVGLLSTITQGSDQVSDGLADLAAALGYAEANGGLGEVELVLGTEPFTVTPPGVPAREVAPPAGPPLSR